MLTVTSGLLVHLEAASLDLSTGAAVASWPNSAATNIMAAQAVATNQPMLVTNSLNGAKVVRFDGNNDRLQLSENIFTANSFPRTLFAVINSGDHVGHIVGANADGNQHFIEDGYGIGIAAGKPFAKALSDSNGVWLLAKDNVQASNPHIIQATMTDAESRLQTNCALATSTATPDPLVVGNAYIGGFDDSSDSFEGDLAELIIYDRVLSAAEQAEVWGYLSNRYAIPDNVGGDRDGDGVLDACDDGRVYLGEPTISATLESPMATTDGELSDISDLDSRLAFDPHTRATHVFFEHPSAQFYFDLNSSYTLKQIHFWNYTETDATAEVVFTFYDENRTELDQTVVATMLGFGNILAEDFHVDIANVRYIRALLSGSNGKTEVMNIGFSGIPVAQ